MERLPVIIPTPSGYDFARLLETHLRENYLPKRGITARPGELWATTDVTIFADTDCMVELKEHIRGADVYIICDVESSATPLPPFADGAHQSHIIHLGIEGYGVAHDGTPLAVTPRKESLARHFDILLSTVEAARNAVKEAGRITAVLPFFASSRQDRRGGRRSLDLKRRVVLLEACGCDHVLTIDIHNESTELAFGGRTGFDSLFSAHTIINHLRRTRDLSNTYIVAPDAGAFRRNRIYAEELGVPVSFLYKYRDQNHPNVVQGVMGFGGKVEDLRGKDVVIVDDMIDTGGTLIEAATFLRSTGVEHVTAIAGHAVLSPPAIERLGRAVNEGVLRDVVVTNSIAHPAATTAQPWILFVDISKYFAKAIDRLNQGASLSELLKETG
jgi:ribose-phosphate pyrophosphokinase